MKGWQTNQQENPITNGMKAEKVENDQPHKLMSQEKQGYRKGSLDRPLKFKFDKLFIKYDNLNLVDDGLVVRRVSVQLFSFRIQISCTSK